MLIFFKIDGEEKAHPGSEVVLVLQQCLDKNWCGFIKVQGLAEFRELLWAKGAAAAGIKTVKNFL